MKLVDLSIKDFLDQVDSSKPAPGGGSVASVASSLGIALSRMVGHLTTGKKKYKALDEEIKQKYQGILDHFVVVKETLVHLVDEDTLAFNKLMDAFRLPKETDQDKEIRKKAIEDATYEAIEVPYRVASLSLQALGDLEYLLDYCNKNAVSDIGVAALMLYSGLEGALLNVLINVGSLSNEEIKARYEKEVKQFSVEGGQLKDKVLIKVRGLL
jgi:formiminotetrahydrofolate cyclodeaminase